VKFSWDYMKRVLDWKEKGELRKIDYDVEIDKLEKEFHVIIPSADHGLIHKDELMNVDRLICSKDGFTILSFTLIVGDKAAKSSSNVLTKKMRRIIDNANLNDKAYFEDLETEGPDKSIRQIGSILLKIK